MTIENNFPGSDNFPDKPSFEKGENSIAKSIWSMVLFIGLFYLFFKKDINFILILVIVLMIHELGHFIAMKFFNYKDVKIFFIPLLGALVTGEKQEISQRERSIIILAGPIPGIVIGLILYYFGVKGDSALLKMYANLFLFLNVFNLLPLMPLDGGQLIETLFFNKKNTLQTIFSIISAIGLIAIAFYLESYIFLIVPLFMFSRLNTQLQIKKIKLSLDKEGIDYNKTFEEFSNKEYWLIRDHVITGMSIFRNIPPGEYKISDKEKLIVNMIKSLYIKKPIQNFSKKLKFLFLCIWLLFAIGPFVVIAIIRYQDWIHIS